MGRINILVDLRGGDGHKRRLDLENKKGSPIIKRLMSPAGSRWAWETHTVVLACSTGVENQKLLCAEESRLARKIAPSLHLY